MELIKIIDVCNSAGVTMYNASQLPKKYESQEYNQYYNFCLKHSAIVNRKIYLNELIQEYHRHWKNTRDEPTIPSIKGLKDINDCCKIIIEFYKHNVWQQKRINNHYKQEELILHFRKLVDDCLNMMSVVIQIFVKDSKTNWQRPFESIGEVLNQIDKFPMFFEQKDFLKFINDMSNASKHCMVNTITEQIGKDEPSIFLYINHKNELYNVGYTLDFIVQEVNAFYSVFDAYLKQE